MTNRDKDNSVVPMDGEILPAQSAWRDPSSHHPQMSLSETGTRGIGAILYRWGFANIAKAVEAQTAVEIAVAKLHDAQRSRAVAEGKSLTLAEIRENARLNQLAQLEADAEIRRAQAATFARATEEREMLALNNKIKLMAKRREVRVAEEIDKRDSVAKVALAKEKSILARKRLDAAGYITKAQIEKVVLEALHDRNKALKNEAASGAEALIAEAVRRSQSEPEDPEDNYTHEEINDGFIAEFELREKNRGLTPAEQDLLDRLRAFMKGRSNAKK